MVAILLQRGNLHRVPDVPRRWPVPTPKISLKDFKSLLTRRSKALSLLRSSHSPPPNANPSPIPLPSPKLEENPPVNPQLEADKFEPQEEKQIDEASKAEPPPPAVGSGGGDITEKLTEGDKEKEAEVNDSLGEKEQRKKEIEEKLRVLNEKKHNLVQVLKQILNAEEQLNAKKDPPLASGHPSVPLQVDVSNDSGSMSRQLTPRIGSEGNVGGDGEARESEDASNQNAHSRLVLQSSGLSPSSESPLRRPSYFQHNAVLHPSRSSLGTTGSPSRFAPTGQGNPANLPAVSVSGTNYIASSPSPAASGGTSAFRDARQPSPWN